MVDSKKGSENAQPCKSILNKKAAIITAVVLLFILAIALAVGLTIYFTSDCKRGLRIIPRNKWMADPPTPTINLNILPIHRVIIFETATESCSTEAFCSYSAKIIQVFHMTSRQFNDISYNFLIGGDGYVYEGRGWDLVGAHSRHNEDSLGIAFIGTFHSEEPPAVQIEAAQLLLKEGVKLKKLAPDYRIYGARQWGPTSSPGDALYEIIKKWPHWTQDN